ncbi:hypothetical protein ACOI22_01090 [Glaciecola sp. 2405UD65-10]|uniref:hypothetical protein n=1 Tax=Glaciecola sp. 2405UD65-10 TaxID=3397244 RepID=UPI003B5AF5D9
MFNRSRKYIFLLFINLIVLIVLYINTDNDSSNDPFNTEFVLSLIEEAEARSKTIRLLEDNLNNANNSLFETQVQLQQTRILTSQSEQKFQLCQTELRATNQTNTSHSANSAEKCESQARNLSVSSAKLAELETQLKQSQQNYIEAQTALTKTQQKLDSLQKKSANEVSILQAQVSSLNTILNKPIFLTKHFMNARYCDKPSYSSRICVTEFMIRPSFSKLPASEVSVKIIDSNDNIVTEEKFEAFKERLYRIPMGRGVELASGYYSAVYTVDNQTIVAEAVSLSQ